MKYEPKPHQTKAIDEAHKIVKKKGLVYIFGQPRVGKSLIALGVVNKLRESTRLKGKALVLTKKNAIEDWLKYEDPLAVVTNYEQITKFRSKDFDFVIIDEAHNFSAFPRPSERIKLTKSFCKDKPIIFLSGTPLVEGLLRAYSQFSLSSYSPFRNLKGPYDFFRTYGVPHTRNLCGRSIELYNLAKDAEIRSIIEPYFVKVTYEDAGFNYQNKDKVILLESPETIRLCNKTKKDQFIQSCPLPSISAITQCMHRLCGGFYSQDGIKVTNIPQIKLEWLKGFINELPKNSKIAIMCYFIEEQEALSYYFKGIADVYSSTKYCEGIDLSYYDCFILYSFGYSGAKFIQLRDRIVNITKDRETQVIVPLINKGIDSMIYETVSQKKNFNLKILHNYQEGSVF